MCSSSGPLLAPRRRRSRAVIDRRTWAQIAPELINHLTPAAVVQKANADGALAELPELTPEAFARGVEFALRLERDRIARLAMYYGKLATNGITPGEILGRRVVHTLKIARMAWRESRGIRWQ
jgi:hypothetical protein